MNKLFDNLECIYRGLKNENKTIHCLTNPIAINDMANVILSLGQSPIMADNPREVKEITEKSAVLLLNLGNIKDYRMEAMEKSAKVANLIPIPLILDLVGVSASKLRLDFALNLLKAYKFDLVKGNYSEIYSLYEEKTSTSGVDSKDLDYLSITKKANILSQKYDTKILASGKKDIVCGNKQTYILANGDYRLKKITGSGCILGAICACSLAIENSLEAIILGLCIENISSENIDKNIGMASFKLKFLDKISLIDIETIKERIAYEKY
ncbi:MAG: hydroxyethylthiazole kinase [Peptoniphilaceae bacterium]|nr:hydroxyethylthiazole kinase [Peptoniphilaceae bacterium]MDY6019537.1 hydroxyethylthiazole kinase [Anaerococcus sp.]